MDGCKKNSHAVHDIKYHVIWVTKYRYKVLRGQIAIRTRELIRQGCEARELQSCKEVSEKIIFIYCYRVHQVLPPVKFYNT